MKISLIQPVAQEPKVASIILPGKKQVWQVISLPYQAFCQGGKSTVNTACVEQIEVCKIYQPYENKTDQSISSLGRFPDTPSPSTSDVEEGETDESRLGIMLMSLHKVAGKVR